MNPTDNDRDDLLQRVSALEATVHDLCVAVGIPSHSAATRRPPPLTAAATTPVTAAPQPLPAAAHARPQPAPTAQPLPASQPVSARRTEELVGRQGLAIVGGLAVLIGIIFFVALAIRRGLIPPSARMALAAIGSALLVVAAERLHRRDSERTLIGVLALVGTLGGFATLAATIAYYDLLPAWTAVVIAPLIGAVAVWAARTFRMQFLATVGMAVTMIVPATVWDDPTTAIMLYAVLVMLGGFALALWQRWQTLWAVGVILTPTFVMSWADWQMYDDRVSRDPRALGIAVAVLYLLAHLATGVIGDRRWSPDRAIDGFVIPLLPLGVAAGTGMGAFVLSNSQHSDTPAKVWVTCLALALTTLGAVIFRQDRKRLIGPYIGALGFALVALAIGLWLRGPGLVVGWSAQAVASAWLARRLRDDRVLLGTAATAAAALVAALKLAPPRGLGWTIDRPYTGMFAVLAVAVALGAIAALIRPIAERFLPFDGHRTAGVAALAAVAGLYGISVGLVQALGTADQSTQVVLSVFWAIIGLGLIVVGLLRDLAFARIGGLGLLGLALGKLVLFDLRYLNSISRALSFILVGLLALGGAYAYQKVRSQFDRDETPDQPER